MNVHISAARFPKTASDYFKRNLLYIKFRSHMFVPETTFTLTSEFHDSEKSMKQFPLTRHFGKSFIVPV